MEKMFPIQAQRGAAPHPLKIPWSVAEKAWSVYTSRYPGQTMEHMARRGGFAPSEMDAIMQYFVGAEFEKVEGMKGKPPEFFRRMGEIVAQRTKELSSLRAEVISLKEREGECVHCGEEVVGDDVNHWKTCSVHPANIRLTLADELLEDVAKLLRVVWSSCDWFEKYQVYKDGK